MGDGTVLTRVMRAMHRRFPTMPFYIVGKEISLEDVRLTLEKMADRFFEHPATVLVRHQHVLHRGAVADAEVAVGRHHLVWNEVALTGNTAHEFERADRRARAVPRRELAGAAVSPKTGNPVYERPVVLVIYREDHRFLLDPIIPRRGARARRLRPRDRLAALSRARAASSSRPRKVIAPLAPRARPGGRLIGIHSYGHDPGLEIVQQGVAGRESVPDRPPRHPARGEARARPARARLQLQRLRRQRARSSATTCTRCRAEITGSIGTSTLFAAWNAAIYVAQIEDERLARGVGDGRYLEATREVLQKHGGSGSTTSPT